jgi:uncharacterized protein (DUF983 family)
VIRTTSADAIPSLRAALNGGCPRCGDRTLFAGWLRLARECRTCGLDIEGFNVGDGPAAFLIFIVGTIVVVSALVVDGVLSPPWWVHLIWIPIATALTIAGLRVSKALLLAQEYRQSAREGRVVR